MEVLNGSGNRAMIIVGYGVGNLIKLKGEKRETLKKYHCYDGENVGDLI
jgi:hypothetical protein